ncbi:MAG: 16S rRNA (cytidine(1402)-2'-O)-methyltransferase, partial [Acidimicrobiales bacterium]
MTEPAAGRLRLVGTPIGNLADLSPRAAESLRVADLIACEDTRRTRALLTAHGISGKELVALHGHNEHAQAERVVARLLGGATVALVSDAGMPTVSDPGQHLVAAASAAGVVVEVVPGPSAALAALAISGLPTDRFCFEGFLPRKGRDRRDRLDVMRTEERTAVLFEAPHRLRETLADLVEVCGSDRPIAVARELTKLYEETWRGTVGAAVARWTDVEPRREFVIVAGGAEPAGHAEKGALEAAL